MKIYKFGGASVKDADNVRNVAQVLRTVGYSDCLLIASAMGKTTNALEVVVHNYFQNPIDLDVSLQFVRTYHLTILRDLFAEANHFVYEAVDALFESLTSFLATTKSPNYNFVYDQVVSYGELLSTTILHHYLQGDGIENTWIDARNLIKTDTTYRDANVEWESTCEFITKAIDKQELYITQGFIGSDYNGFSTTLGREGSDYSAAIFAYALAAECVTIWKDVPESTQCGSTLF